MNTNYQEINVNADKYNITTTQAIELFDRYCPDMRNPIEEAICIDEFSNTRKSHDKYSCILVGFTSHKIIDIIKSRTLQLHTNSLKMLLSL